MMSNNRRSAPVINDHLPIEETSGDYSSDRKRLEKIAAIILNVTSRWISSPWGVTYLLKNQLYMYKTMDETDLRLLLIIRRVTVK
jgi:hypothetical protein